MPKSSLTKYSLMIFVLLSNLTLASCGTKGPLYIPEQRYPQGAEKAPATPPANQPNKE